MREDKVIVIVGPTGSGKTGVSLEIAKAVASHSTAFSYKTVEIISADSRAIYKGMDIGTAKPTIKEQEVAKHWGIDLVEPGERFTVFDWKKYAEEKIKEIYSRGNLPIIVGGTGLYVDALVYDYQFSDSQLRKCVKIIAEILILLVQEGFLTKRGIWFHQNQVCVTEEFSAVRNLCKKAGVEIL